MIRFVTPLIAAMMAFGAFAASPLEGDWQVNGGGARLRFVPAAGTADSFEILWVDGPDLSIAPGTKIGSAVATPAAGTFDCSIDTDPRGPSDKKRRARFAIRINPETADDFTFVPYEQGYRFSPQALLPYWWRRPVRQVDSRPSGLDGARRVGAPKPYVEL